MTPIDPDELRVLREKADAFDALERLINVSLVADAVVGRQPDGLYFAAANFALRPTRATGPTLLAAVQAAAGGKT